MTGHLLSGAGGLESVLTVMAIHKRTSPPTINLHNPDPLCDLDYSANEARALPIEYAMKNSLGFGGSNGTMIFKAPWQWGMSSATDSSQNQAHG